MPSPKLKPILRSQKVTLILVAFLMVFPVAGTALIVHRRNTIAAQEINYSQLYRIADSAAALSLTIEGETLTVQNKDGSLAQATVTSEAAQQTVVELFRQKNVAIEFVPQRPGSLATALNWLLPLLTVGLLGIIGWRVYRSMSGRDGNFKCLNVGGTGKVTFADVAGVDEARAELAETIDFLRNPARFSRLGGRIPRGILLSGLPGTGKTLLARAAANEAGVPFLAASGSSFQEKFAGVGAARVRRLFVEARKLAPCVIFIDEIDALGRQRGRSNDSASADQDQTLNQLLIELDGFDQMSSIVVIASTNRPDILDNALTRPGRFDREITVGGCCWTGSDS